MKSPRLGSKWLAFAVFVAACSKPSASAGDASSGSAAAAPLNSAPGPTPTPSSDAVPPVAAALPAASSAASPFPAASSETVATPPNDPASTESEGNTVVSGCLASAGGTPTRAAPTKEGAPGVEVIAGAIPKIVHRLEHACCLHSRTRVVRSARSIQVVEELSGTPCRCRCSSTLTTELHVPSGNYELAVVLDQGGARSEVYRGALPVAGSDSSPSTAPGKPSPQLPRSIHVPAAK